MTHRFPFIKLTHTQRRVKGGSHLLTLFTHQTHTHTHRPRPLPPGWDFPPKMKRGREGEGEEHDRVRRREGGREGVM